LKNRKDKINDLKMENQLLDKKIKEWEKKAKNFLKKE
jgi:hypothetical protein